MLDEPPVHTAVDAIHRFNEWLLHMLKCSSWELNTFAKMLDKPLLTILLEDSDLDGNLTQFWRQNVTNLGFAPGHNTEICFDGVTTLAPVTSTTTSPLKKAPLAALPLGRRLLMEQPGPVMI